MKNDLVKTQRAWMMVSRNRVLSWLAVAITLAGAARPVCAAENTWTGGGSSANWSDAGNWTDGVPANGDTLTFRGNTRQANTNDLLTSIGSVVIEESGFNISGNALTLNGTFGNTGNNTWAIPLTLTSSGKSFESLDGTLTLSGNIANAGNTATFKANYGIGVSGPITVSGIISGTGGIIKDGSGMVALTGNNTYSGKTTITQGNLAVSKDGNLGTVPGSDTLNIELNGGYLMASDSFTLSSKRLVRIIKTGGLTGFWANSGVTLTYGGVISAQNTSTSYGLRLDGEGSIFLSGNSTYRGMTTIYAYVVRISHARALGFSTTMTIAVNNLSTLELAGGITVDKPLTLDYARLVNHSGDNTWSGEIQTLINSSGKSVISARAGTLLTLSGSIFINTDTETSPLNSMQNLYVEGDGDIAVTGDINGDGTDGEGGYLLGHGDVVMDGTGTLTLSAENYNSGRTIVNSGVVVISDDTNLGEVPGSATAGRIVINGGTLMATADVTLDSNRGIALGPPTGSGSGTIQVDVGCTVAYDGIIADNAGGDDELNLTGEGTLIISGSSTYSGGTTIHAGTLLVNNSTGSGTGTGAVTVNDTATLGGNGTIGGAVTVKSGGRVEPGGTGASVDTLKIAGNVTFESGSTYEVEIGSGTTCDKLDLLGTGTLTLGSGVSILDIGALTGEGRTIAINVKRNGITGEFRDTAGNRLEHKSALHLVPNTAYYIHYVNKTDSDDGYIVLNTSPTAAEGLIRIYATPGGVVVEFETTEETGQNDIVLYLYRDGQWVEVGRQPAAGAGSHTYQFEVAGLNAGDIVSLTVLDDEGTAHTAYDLPVGHAAPQGTPVGQGVLLYTPSAAVTRFEASTRQDDGKVSVQWQTSAEFGVEAFRVLRQRADGAPVGLGYVRSQGDEAGGAYELADDGVKAGDTVRYELRIVSPHGPGQRVAEWAGMVQAAPAQPQPLTVMAATAEAPQARSATAAAWIGSGDRVRDWTDSAPADRVRLSLREEGIYRVSAQELADAAGWDVADVTAAISNTNLSLHCQGSPVAWYADGADLLFHGVSADSRFAPENVYWIAWGPGSNMPSRMMMPETPATTNAWFMNRIIQQGTTYLARVSYSTLADSPAPYVAFPGPLLAGGSRSYNETLIDCAPGLWTGSVTVNLLSYYEVGTDDHAASVSVGGTLVGNPSWSGEQYVSFVYPFSSTNLAGGAAALSLANVAIAPPLPATDYTRFLCMSYEFSYACLYRARNGVLRCTGGTGNTVAVSGFASNDVVVLDVTVPHQPVVVDPVTITYDGGAGNWVASFPCGDSGQVYQVFSKSTGTRQPAVRGVRDVDWASPTNAADYVILIPPEAWRDGFRAALQPLADFRNAQGLRTLIVDVESIYNRYSYGLVDPLAIRAFCGDGSTRWSTHPLRYVLLAGAGALDFKHQRLSVNDYTACLIPPLIAGQGFLTGEGMTVAIDAALGDADGDGVPEVAVGRLPTTKTQDLAVVVQKTIAYEGALLWKQQASVAADWDNTGNKYFPFSAGTDRLIEPLEGGGRGVVKHYPIDDTGNLVPVKTESLFPALSAGSGLFHFFGHTDEQNLGGGSGKLLRNADISVAHWRKPTIAAIIGCRPNRWHSLTATVCIMPYGLFAADTGFVAGLGATGYMLGDEGEHLSVSLYTEAAAEGPLRLGDVWRQTLQEMTGKIPAERLLSFSLIGDPALVFRHDVSAMGTPVSWLVEYGLTAPNADLDDPDQDGWPSWQEYAAGTDPTHYALRILAAGTGDPDRWTIAFEADSNLRYHVEYKPSLLSADDWQAVSWAWTNAPDWASPGIPVDPQGPVTAVDVQVSSVSTQGFYRIRAGHEP